MATHLTHKQSFKIGYLVGTAVTFGSHRAENLTQEEIDGDPGSRGEQDVREFIVDFMNLLLPSAQHSHCPGARGFGPALFPDC